MNIITDTMADLDKEWQDYLNIDIRGVEIFPNNSNQDDQSVTQKRPICSDIRISTKVKVMLLNVKTLEIYYIYWKLLMIKHWEQREGIIKKQIKYTCYSKKEYDELLNRARLDTSMAIVT